MPALSIALAAALVLPVGARAQATPSRVDQLRAQAEEAYRNGDNLRALSFLEQAYAADPQPAILANRGLILERVGDTHRAIADFEAYLASSPPAEKRATAETALRRLRPEVLIGSDRPGLTLYLDDATTAAGATPLRLDLPVGAHLVRYEGDRVTPGQTAFIVEAGKSTAVQLHAVSAVTALASTEARPADGRTRTWAYVSLVSGIGAAVAGGVLTLVMQEKKDDRDSAASLSDWKSADTTAEHLQTGAGVAFGVSVAALASGLYFWFNQD